MSLSVMSTKRSHVRFNNQLCSYDSLFHQTARSNTATTIATNQHVSMHIGVCKIRLRIPDSQSLKAKRRVVKSLIAKLKNRFNIAIAEVDALNAHQFAVLAAVSVSNDSAHLNKLISHVVNFVEANVDAELMDYETEFFF